MLKIMTAQWDGKGARLNKNQRRQRRVEMQGHNSRYQQARGQAMTSTRYSTLLGIFSLLVPYSEILLLGQVPVSTNLSCFPT